VLADAEFEEGPADRERMMALGRRQIRQTRQNHPRGDRADTAAFVREMLGQEAGVVGERSRSERLGALGEERGLGIVECGGGWLDLAERFLGENTPCF
jgi:hypothetical protein